MKFTCVQAHSTRLLQSSDFLLPYIYICLSANIPHLYWLNLHIDSTSHHQIFDFLFYSPVTAYSKSLFSSVDRMETDEQHFNVAYDEEVK